MGEETPEAVEIQCPGCGTRFRLTPKKGRLPSGDIPCPKCFEEIPVQEGEVISEEDTSGDDEQKSEAPKFGVTAPPRPSGATKSDPTSDDSESGESEKDPSEKADEDDAIARLERMAAELGSGSAKSTMAGLPGVGGTNPFAASRSQDKTAAVDPSILQKVATESSEVTDDDDDPAAGDWRPVNQPDTSPRLVSEQTIERLAQESSEVALAPEDLPDEQETRPAGLRRDGVTKKTKIDSKAANKLRETAENSSVSADMVKRSRSSAGGAKSKKSPKKSSLLARIKKKTVRKGDLENSPSPSASADATAPAMSLDRLKKKAGSSSGVGLPAPSTAESDSEASDATEPKSLSDLFKKVQKKRGTQSGVLRKRLQEKSTGSEDATKEMDVPDVDFADEISEGELADLVDETTEKSNTSPPMPDLPAAVSKKPSKPAASKSPQNTSKIDNPEHSGLFAGVEPSSPKKSEPPELGEVSRDRSQPTSHSMLARLNKRTDRGDNIDAIQVGAAGESRGSGYIRLPTAEIHDVLGHGNYRLKIEGVVYEPVDKEGLTQLIKGGVLLGAEEIADADGDWMPASKHPVFGELRRKMAAEAHQVLSRIGSSNKKAKSTPPPEPSSAPPPELTKDSASSEIPDEPATTELSATETAAIVSGMTDRLAAVDSADDGREEAAAEPEGGFPTRESFEAIPLDMEPELDSGPEFAEEKESPADPEDETVMQAEPASTDGFKIPTEEPIESGARESSDVYVEPAGFEGEDDSIDMAEERDIQAAEDALADVQKTRSKRPLAIGIALVGVVVAAGAAMILTEAGNDIVEDVTGWSPAALFSESEPDADAEPPIVEEADPAVSEAIEQAEEIIFDAIPSHAFSDATSADEWARERLEDHAHENVVELMKPQWDVGRRDRDFIVLFVDVLLENQDYTRARRVALEGMVEFPDSDELSTLHRRAVSEDERFVSGQFVTLDDATDYEAHGLYAAAGHQGFVLAQSEATDEQLVFKPSRSGWENGWRAEVAAWRFCELVICHFDVFKVEPAVLTRDFLDDVQGDTAQFSTLAGQAQWRTIEIDGEEVQAVRGSLEYLSTETAAPFPIEYRPLWRNWLSAGSTSSSLQEPIAENLGRLADLAEGAFYDELVRALGDTQTGEVARQVSSLLLFDYLTNNWERFFTRVEDYGTNNPVIGGLLVSRHNGEAFQPRSSRRVQGRFEWTTRFSRSTVASIRALERDLVFEVLFPEATVAERRRLEVMWSQRENMLDRVDQLIARHGEEDVLLFP